MSTTTVARTSLCMIPYYASRNIALAAVDAAERHALGTATLEEVRAARDAAIAEWAALDRALWAMDAPPDERSKQRSAFCVAIAAGGVALGLPQAAETARDARWVASSFLSTHRA